MTQIHTKNLQPKIFVAHLPSRILIFALAVAWREQEGQQMDRPSYKVFLGGLPVRADKQQLITFFSAYGTVLNCKLKRNAATGRSQGFAYLMVKERTAYERLLNESVHFQDRVIEVKPVWKKKELGERLEQEKAKKLFIHNLAVETTNHDMQAHFSKYGVVTNAFIIKDPMTQKNKNYGYVIFEDLSAIERAMQETHWLHGNELRLKQSIENEQIAVLKQANPPKDSGGKTTQLTKPREQSGSVTKLSPEKVKEPAFKSLMSLGQLEGSFSGGDRSSYGMSPTLPHYKKANLSYEPKGPQISGFIPSCPAKQRETDFWLGGEPQPSTAGLIGGFSAGPKLRMQEIDSEDEDSPNGEQEVRNSPSSAFVLKKSETPSAFNVRPAILADDSDEEEPDCRQRPKMISFKDPDKCSIHSLGKLKLASQPAKAQLNAHQTPESPQPIFQVDGVAFIAEQKLEDRTLAFVKPTEHRGGKLHLQDNIVCDLDTQ